MKHTYNNHSYKIFEGFYESNLYNSDSTYWIEQIDREENYLKDNEYYDIDDWQGFKNEVAELATAHLFEILPDNEIIQSIKLKEVYSPKYYNYETDCLILDMKLNLTKLKKYCFTTHKDNFNKYLKDNFTSYDGFISYVKNNINDFINEYKTSISNTLEINTMIEYYLLSQIYESNDSKDFNGFETSYHNKNYDCLNEIIYKYLVTHSNDENKNIQNELTF